MITADRESYAITTIKFLDSDSEDSSKMQIFVYVNGEQDSSITKNDPSTTIFMYSKDMIVLEIYLMAKKLGEIEVSMEELFLEHKQAGNIFQKWFGYLHGNILLQFKIQEIQQSQNEFQRQSAMLFNESGNEIGQQSHFNQKNDQKNNNIPKNKNNIVNQKDIDASPEKNTAFNIIARGGYQFQKLHSPLNKISGTSPIGKTQPADFQAKNSPSKQPKTPEKYKYDQLNENSVTYNQLEEHLAEISRKIYCRSFNAIVEKKRSKYIELKNLLTQIQQYYTQLSNHPCRSCEKKYFPLIINGLNTLNQQYNHLKQSIELQHQQDSIQSPEQLAVIRSTPNKGVSNQMISQSSKNKPNQILGSSNGKTNSNGLNGSTKNKNGLSFNDSQRKSAISPISTPNKNLEKSKNQRLSLSKSPMRIGTSAGNKINKSSASKEIQEYGEGEQKEEDFRSPLTKTKEAELKLEEEKADNLEKNAEFVREQLEIQFKRTNELEGENRKLRLKNFIIEADLKNLIKRMSLDKLTFAARASFKMNEFREIFEFYHALRLEHTNLINEVESLKIELGIEEPDSQEYIVENNKQGKSSGSKMNFGQKYGQNSHYNISNEQQRSMDQSFKKDTNFRGSSEKKERSSVADIHELLSQRKNVYAELMEKLHEH